MKTSTKLLSGVSSSVLVTALVGCSGDLPPEPTGYECDDWEWNDDTQTYYCDDDDSIHGGSYFYGGKLYKTKKLLSGASGYSSYKSGMGSGSKGGFGG